MEFGAKTNQADIDFVAQSTLITEQLGTFDSRSESNIITLIPKAQIAAGNFGKRQDNNKDARIISGNSYFMKSRIISLPGKNKARKCRYQRKRRTK
jgi:hypothetical protein